MTLAVTLSNVLYAVDGMTKRVKSASKMRRGYDALRDVESITIRLDNGKSATFVLADEVKVPKEPAALRREARRASATAAFWGYQAGRAKRRLTEAEWQFERVKAATSVAQRSAFNEVRGGYTERLIEAMVTLTDDDKLDVQGARKRLTQAQEHYDVVSAIAKATQNRVFIIQKLVGTDDD